MSQRKILVAKRHDQRPFNRNTQNSSSIPITNQAQKRGHESEDFEPPNKRRNNNVSKHESNNFTSPRTKNLAAKRLQNLRNSLENQRRLSESGQCPMAINSPLTKLNVSTPIVNSLENQRRFSESGKSPMAINSPPTKLNSSTPVVNNLGHQRRFSECGKSPMTINSSTKLNSSTPVVNVNERLKRKSSCLSSTPSRPIIPVQNPSHKEKSRVSSILNSSCRTSLNVSNSIPNVSNVANVSKVSNVNVANVSAVERVEDEGMDWTDIDYKAVVNDVIDIRKEINYNNKNLQIAKDLDNVVCYRSDGVFIVVDTNIFLSHLMLLSDLKGKHIAGLGSVTIVVPWMVLQELDYMKDSHGNRISKAARKAVSYINSLLQAKDPHFTGQTVMDAAKSEMSSSNPDDGIVFSCLQLVQRGKQTVLLSNDTNLRNKALVHSIRSYTHTDIASLTSTATSPATPVRSVTKLKLLLSGLLTRIVSSELQEAYGAVWSRMGGPQPPFTTEEALGVMNKYWVAVFGFQLQKQARGKVDEFGEFLKRHTNDANYNSENFNKFIELSLSLCIYLKNGYAKHRDAVIECISNIQKHAEC